MPLAWRSQKPDPKTFVSPALSYAQSLNKIVATAKKSSAHQNVGWLGRRKQGLGENFWQFRPYNVGDAPNQIDWRRSARENKPFIKEREWESQQKIWLWPDQSKSMQFRSNTALHSKAEHALLLSFILAELFLRSNESVGVPQILPSINHGSGAEKMALAFLNYQRQTPSKEWTKFPHFTSISAPSDIVLISDFLLPELSHEDTITDNLAVFSELKTLTALGARLYLIEIIDPIEETFPYKGSVHFHDLLSEEEQILQKTETLQKAYQALYLQKRKWLTHISKQYGWVYLQSYTHQLLEKTLIHLGEIFSKVTLYR